MLPLWIIDLTVSADRRSRFCDLLGQTKYVYMPQDDKDAVDGEYRWMYTHYKSEFGHDLHFYEDLSERTDTEVTDFSNDVYNFQNILVADGQKFVRMVRQSSLHAYTALNICVLGDATEEFTQLVFPSVALLLQKEKGRMLANHIHQGMSVIGAMFVPSNINSFEVNVRENMLRTLMEVHVQHQLTTVHGYDHVLLYQDVQNRVDKYYPLLDANGQAEYIYQCLLHLYYACNTQHPLISGVGAADAFYLSMGVASVVFDNENQDIADSRSICNRLFQVFYSVPENDDVVTSDSERRKNESFLMSDVLSVKRTLRSFYPPEITLEAKLPEPKPHPLYNFTAKFLKRRYYWRYLRDLMPEFRRLMNDEVDRKTKTVLEEVHNSFNRSIRDLQNVHMPEGVKRFFERCNPNEGGIYAFESRLKNLKDDIATNKKRITDYTENYIWNQVETRVPKKYHDAFISYHDAYRQDLESKAGSKYCDEMKNEAINSLCNHLSLETPLLSRLVRTFFFGLIMVICTIPIIDFLMPRWHVRNNAGIWSFLIFMIPVMIELFSAIRYIIKRERKFNRLKAYFTHDSYARIANRIISEASGYYDKALLLCERYLSRAERMKTEINDFPIPEKLKELLPRTQFNQPLVNGDFCGHKVLDEKSLERKLIYINHLKKPIDNLSPDDCYSLVHLMKDYFFSLFSDVKIPEDHPFVREKNGAVRLLSIDEVKEREQQMWDEKRTTFMDNVINEVKDQLVPLKYPSVCDMIMQHYENVQKRSFFKPFVNYAATNGEFVTSADIEHADIKTINAKISRLASYFLPDSTVYQEELCTEDDDFGEDDESIEAQRLYSKYIFLTRWISFDDLSLNRILPKEDFDIEEQKRQINEEDRSRRKKNHDIDNEFYDIAEYPISSSSTLLWALCGCDSTIIWLKLFHSDVLNRARAKGEIILNILTQKD